jgi:hypothetical protein
MVLLIHPTTSREFLGEQTGDRRFFPMPAEPAADAQTTTMLASNRELRRAAERAAKRKTKLPAPRKYAPIVNAFEYVRGRATTLTAVEREKVLQPAREGFTALREGVATYLQWAHVANAMAVALAIEELGIVRGMQEHFGAADLALAAVRKRVQDSADGAAWGRCTTLYFDEIAALREGLHLHEFQLKRLAVFELHQGMAKALKDAHALGGEVITPTQPEQIQEQLL